MSESFLVTVVPLKYVGTIVQSAPFGYVGWQSQSRYVQTPHLYEVNSLDIITEPWLAPRYIGDSRDRWLTGYVYLDVLAERYPQDEFLKRCQDPKLMYEEGETVSYRDEKAGKEIASRQTIASLSERGGRTSVYVRMVRPPDIRIKYRRKGLFDRNPTPYIALG
jgi:hypothetical protein